MAGQEPKNSTEPKPMFGQHLRCLYRDLKQAFRESQGSKTSSGGRNSAEEPLFGTHIRETFHDLQQAWREARRRSRND